MLSELLWLYGAKRQYDMQRENGLAGLLTVLGVIFMVWQWDSIFYPLFDTLGLASAFENSGMVTGTPIHTTINVLATIFVGILLLGLIVSVPTFLLLSVMNLFGSNYNPNRPTAIQYAVSIVLLPILLVAFALVRLLQFVGIFSKPPKTLADAVKSNPTYKNVYGNAKVNHNDKTKLPELYVLQQATRNDHIERTPLTKDEAIKALNIAIASLEMSKDYIFGYHTVREQWYLLTPNPTPVYASKTLANAQANYHNESPYGYNELYMNFFSHQTGLGGYLPEPLEFYVPALPIHFEWDNKIEEFVMELKFEALGTVVTLEMLTDFQRLHGDSINAIYEKACRNYGLNSLTNLAHVLSYLIPMAYPEELNRFKHDDVPCYFREMKKIPHIDTYAPLYRADVLLEVTNAAQRNSQWAKNFLTNPKQ